VLEDEKRKIRAEFVSHPIQSANSKVLGTVADSKIKFT